MTVLVVLMGVLAGLFAFSRQAAGQRFFRVIPLLLCAYFLPTLLSNTGVIPTDGDFPLYEFVKRWLLPASLVLLTLAVDLKAIFSLGRNAIYLFLAATVSIIIGGPLAFWLCQGLIPPELNDQAWRGLAALAGSWIGGGANFVAIGESVGATESTMSLMVVIDIAVAETWMAFLLFFAGREKQMDAKISADRTTIDAVRQKAEAYQASVARPTDLPSLLLLLFLAFGATALAHEAAAHLPDIGDVVRGFTWVVLVVTFTGLALSFTPARKLEGVGASALGSVFLYLLVATIGAKAEFAAILDPKHFGLLVIGAVWMCFHAMSLLALRRFLKAPIFFLAVGSRANVGGAASAPVVASAFHPALAPVGVLLAIAGYVLGTVGGVACAALLSFLA
ncbi:MAG: DUF819 family protein [Planctomycetes bacterium]|jgi:uncharacterized membrane protein|nr:DUF819 family protein [Planctomycetota bacterium]MBT4028364.1 DUF819 family protein [Planctomycetota bacterium]MBT4561036.1 DUF819 family protein [Planctomycetota bacterium]MBT5101255.1 DUF819 family protein [Planctomycetota bacterium]MBT5119300.1 DUF819 family protein [Planctomycetota bacterium]